ncbi:MAG TPA: BatA domain-containing protein [Cyclobacteriaceae bacterium]|nr:BatA domain-containing protein [Cyclobacteriaceae bacterium]
MSFVYPSFLWALTALSIPIIIHLFNFRKTTRVYFSNTRLLRQVKQETTQKRKLKQYLVLASRLLFLLFLVLAFAQPFIPAAEQLSAGKNKIIYIDNSYSMTLPVEDKFRSFDAATAFVQEIAEVFPPDTRYQLITNDFAPFSNTYKTKAEVLDLLAQLRLSPISRQAAEVSSRMQTFTDEVFWISDFQKSTWGSDRFQFDTLRQWHLVPVEATSTSNVYVDSLWLDNPFVVGGEKNTVRVKLQNDGPRRLEGLIVKLSINGVQEATASATLDPDSHGEISFDISTGLSGLNGGVVSFNDFPGTFDNEFFFTLNFSRQLRIMEIKQDGGQPYVEKVFGNKQLFQFKSYPSSNVDYNQITLADMVVVNGVDRIDPALGASLASYRHTSGTILFIPGTKPDIGSYSATLSLPNLKWLPADVQEELDKPDYNNPLFENIFEERSIQLSMPRAKKHLEWGQDRSAILKFRSGLPFLSQFGHLFVLASPLEKTATDFYQHALFVPVMYRIAASGRKNESQLYYYLTESLVTIRADSIYGEEPVRLVGQQELIPPQRKDVDKVIMELPKFSMNAGFYQAMFRKDTLDRVAFNLTRDESKLDRFTAGELQERFGNKMVSIFSSTSAASLAADIRERYLGTPLWKFALVLSLVFLLAEVLLIRFLK